MTQVNFTPGARIRFIRSTQGIPKDTKATIIEQCDMLPENVHMDISGLRRCVPKESVELLGDIQLELF